MDKEQTINDLKSRLFVLEQKDSQFTYEELDERNKIRRHLDELVNEPSLVKISDVIDTIHKVSPPSNMKYVDKKPWGMAKGAILAAVQNMRKKEGEHGDGGGSSEA